MQLIAQCLLDKNSLVLFFLQCLLPPKKNAAVDEGVRDILTSIIDLLWSQKSYRLAGNTNGQYQIEAGLAERLRNLSSKLVNTETNDNSGKRNSRDKSHIDLPRKKIYESLLVAENTQLLSYYCSIEDANIRLRLEAVQLAPCFTHFHQRLKLTAKMLLNTFGAITLR